MDKSVAVVLAAGMGTRMKSDVPKMLHPVCGKPMLLYVVDALEEAKTERIITVLGHEAGRVQEIIRGRSESVPQLEPLGTGHALIQALPALEAYEEGDCLVLCGDTPLIRGETLRDLRYAHREAGAAATLLTARLMDPFGYGRVIREGRGENPPIIDIVEERDATPQIKQIREINTGAYCFDLRYLKEGLASLKPANAQGEYYLTDLIRYLVGRGLRTESLVLADPGEAMGVNDRAQLAEAEARMRRRILRRHMLEGVTIRDPESTYIDDGVSIGSDTVLEPGVILSGRCVIGRRCQIGPWVRMSGSRLGDDTVVTQAAIMESEVGGHCVIGPYSYIRPETVLSDYVKIGDFVELKKTTVAAGAKIPHLSYVGDSTVGSRVNVGAGTITCNYDGKDKHATVFEDDSFIGSNSNFVAPVRVGKGAYVGAGSTITKDVPPGSLAVARGKQKIIEHWHQNGKD
ncbi:MAG: bifunctional UDP-N-acetylglucosamine diphosphorylase/glucosamine-1-phosphate N-acetyltransferase GlmU [Peptococcaceae bacterium]|nr:bifunctional UDP-N-acetylglucosamine diphosphorylase/glucosamine-1-phosphate N-acetyltransferase GlmU [Peptococcaceae bacterium]